MKLTDNTIDLVCQLEYLIGKETVKRKSQYTYKYPLTAKIYRAWEFEYGPNGRLWDFSYPIVYSSQEFDFGSAEECVQKMQYVFGFNSLYIGKAILNVLNYLENRYGIDFDELESGLVNEQK